MPVPPDRSSHSQRLHDWSFVREVTQVVGTWRATIESFGLATRFPVTNAEQSETAEDDFHRQGYEQAIAVIGATLADAPTLEILMQRHWYSPWETSNASSARKRAREQAEFHALLEDACTRFAPEGERLARHVVLAGAYYRRASQLLSAWWTRDASPQQAEQAASPKEDTQAPQQTQEEPPPHAEASAAGTVVPPTKRRRRTQVNEDATRKEVPKKRSKPSTPSGRSARKTNATPPLEQPAPPPLTEPPAEVAGQSDQRERERTTRTTRPRRRDTQ